MQRINLGLSFSGPQGKSVKNYVKNKVEEILVKSASSFAEVDVIPIFSNTWKEKILSNEIDVVCLPMENVGFDIPKECIVIALHKIEKSGRKIICKKEYFNATEDLKLSRGTTVAVNEIEHGIQLKHLNPNIEYIIPDTSETLLSYFQNRKAAQAILVSDEEIDNISDFENYHIITLHPNEFLENAGNHYLAFIAHRESGELTAFIRSVFHEKDNVPCSNAERTFAKYFSSIPELRIKVHCFKDERNNYFIKAGIIDINKLTYLEHKMSQSTHFRLAEKMIDSFQTLIV